MINAAEFYELKTKQENGWLPQYEELRIKKYEEFKQVVSRYLKKGKESFFLGTNEDSNWIPIKDRYEFKHAMIPAVNQIINDLRDLGYNCKVEDTGKPYYYWYQLKITNTPPKVPLLQKVIYFLKKKL
jgi:hypothetical protein